MTLQTPTDLFAHELAERLDAEQAILAWLPQQIDECHTDEQARSTLQDCQRGTQQQVQNLERCFQALGGAPPKVQAAAVRGLWQEHETFLRQKPAAEILTFYNLEGAAKTEQYEIAAYNGLVEQAQYLGQPEITRLLQENLAQEQTMGRKVQQASQQAGKRVFQQPAHAMRGRG